MASVIRLLGNKKDKILEIGVGSKFLYSNLKRLNYNITSVDFDKNLNPDIIADIKHLPMEDNSYEVVCAFEVLEHLPFDDFKKSLMEMKRVSKKYILFSVPYNAFKFHIALKIIPFTEIKEIEFHIPYLFLNHKFDGQHYWEAGKKNYSLKRIKKEIKKTGLNIVEISPIKKAQHVCFILEKE
jgi:ubiquinone/menaquinone biosynthesis C-methylase UbiE